MLSHRLTDHRVRATTGITPLSVSADRIGLTAMRPAHGFNNCCATAALSDRSGSTGTVVETYPAAALRTWALPYRRYKSKDSATSRAELTELLARTTGVLEPQIRGAVRTHDELDAVVCCLVARAAAVGATNRPNNEELAPARREGGSTSRLCRSLIFSGERARWLPGAGRVRSFAFGPPTARRRRYSWPHEVSRPSRSWLTCRTLG